MDLEYRNGLLYISVKIKYKGKEKIISDIVLDTGAAETIISPDAVEEIGITAERGDKINSYYIIILKKFVFLANFLLETKSGYWFQGYPEF